MYEADTLLIFLNSAIVAWMKGKTSQSDGKHAKQKTADHIIMEAADTKTEVRRDGPKE